MVVENRLTLRKQVLSDLPTETTTGRDRAYPPDELVIDAIDEEALREARERTAARVRLLWNGRRFLMRATVAGLVIATAIAFLIPNRYTSTAELMPPDQSSGTGASLLAALSGSSGLGGIGGGLAGLAENALGIKTTGALFVGILKSDTVQDDVIHKFDLQKVYGKRYLEDARKELAAHTDISGEQKSGLITISVSDHDPRRAAAMAQEYVDKLNWVVTHLSTSSAHRERVFLDQRLKQVKANLEEAEKKFSQFASQKGAIDVPAQGKAMVTAAAALQGELIASESELQGLRQIYTDNNVRVRAVQARVNKLRNSLRKIAGKGADENSSAGELFPSISQLPVLGVTYADLLRRVKVEEAVFETLTKEDELAKVQEAKEIPSVKVLDPPLVPQKKSFPPHLLIMLLGGFLAFTLAVVWLLGRAQWDETDPADPRKVLALEMAATVKAGLPWNARNGSRLGPPARWLAGKFRRSENGRTGEHRSEKAAPK